MPSRIIISEFMDAPAVEAMRAKFNVVYDAGLVDRTAELSEMVAEADAVIVRNRTQVKGALLEACKRVKVIGRLGVGLDNIDVATCKARGIEVIQATGANALAVAEYVIGASMMLLRGTYASSHAVAEGQWPRNALSNGREAAGKTLGRGAVVLPIARSESNPLKFHVERVAVVALPGARNEKAPGSRRGLG